MNVPYSSYFKVLTWMDSWLTKKQPTWDPATVFKLNSLRPGRNSRPFPSSLKEKQCLEIRDTYIFILKMVTRHFKCQPLTFLTPIHSIPDINTTFVSYVSAIFDFGFPLPQRAAGRFCSKKLSSQIIQACFLISTWLQHAVLLNFKKLPLSLIKDPETKPNQ